MSSDNPYQPPQVMDPIQKPHAGDAEGIWRQGNLLVMRKGAVLPDRCVKSNVATQRKLKRSLSWHHPAIFLSIIISLCVYVILAVILSKKAVIHIGLSDEWFGKRSRAIIVGWCSVLLAAVMVIAGIALVDRNDYFAILIVIGVVVFLIGAIFGLTASRMVSPTRIDDTYVWLKGVNPEYLATLPV